MYSSNSILKNILGSQFVFVFWIKHVPISCTMFSSKKYSVQLFGIQNVKATACARSEAACKFHCGEYIHFINVHFKIEAWHQVHKTALPF